MNKRILSIDPSGTGTTGIYYWDKWTEKFSQFTSKEWIEHYQFIFNLVKEKQPDFLLFENSNYVNSRGKDMTSLWKLLGAIEILRYGFAGLITVPIPVNQVKGLRNKLLKGTSSIKDLEYLPGKGWRHNGKKISVHCLDAYLVYWLWKSKANNQPNNKLIGKSISANKNKQNIREND